MKKSLSEEEKWDLIGYIKVSEARYLTLKTLQYQFLMPSEIAKSTNIQINQISKTLQGLKERDLVICLNEQRRKGRLYKATPLGASIVNILDDNSPDKTVTK